eukprot:3255928-Amphidinium_carterae.1
MQRRKRTDMDHTWGTCTISGIDCFDKISGVRTGNHVAAIRQMKRCGRGVPLIPWDEMEPTGSWDLNVTRTSTCRRSLSD